MKRLGVNTLAVLTMGLIAEASAFAGWRTWKPKPSPSPSPSPTVVLNSCKASDLVFTHWPLAGTASKDWVISYFVDDDPSSNSIRDYTGQTGSSAATYDGHTGTDIMIAGFKQMDAGVPIYAAADGVVYATHDGDYDRDENFPGCSPNSGNYVEIQHPNGFFSQYDHMKMNSVAVQPGQSVQAGQIIGYVGSSGCSSAPHVHFEVRDCNQNVVDPMLGNMFAAGLVPSYIPAVGLMDATVRDGSYQGLPQSKDPGQSLTSIPLGDGLLLLYTMAGGSSSDQMVMTVLGPNGNYNWLTLTQAFAGYRFSYWYYWTSAFNQSGTYSVSLQLNGAQVYSASFSVQ